MRRILHRGRFAVSTLIENHLNTAENVLQITSDSLHHMLISGSTPARVQEFLVETIA